MDVEELFYSVPCDQLIDSVKSSSKSNWELGFTNSSGMTMQDFLEQLQFYLNSVVVGRSNSLLLQKKRVSIGSCVAPILSDILRAGVNRAEGGIGTGVFLGSSAAKKSVSLCRGFYRESIIYPISGKSGVVGGVTERW